MKDLRDAHLHLPIFAPQRKYLRFCVQSQHFQFRALPFGLAIAPRVFTKVMAAVGAIYADNRSTFSCISTTS